MNTLFSFIRPEFFDIFGLFVFSFIIATSLWGLITKKVFPQWVLVLFFLIGVLGIIVDGAIVLHTYF